MLTTETMTKINRILKGLVNCELEFHSADSLQGNGWSSHELMLTREKCADRPSFLKSESGGSFGFPLYLNGEFVGLAVISGTGGTMPEELFSLAELLTSIMERKLAQEQMRAQIAQIEEHLEIMDAHSNANTNASSNVIRLRPTRLSRVRQMIETLESRERLEAKEPVLATGPILIEGADRASIHRAAVETHEASGRWAMLSLEDLEADILASRAGLKELGGITLFIADLALLAPEQQTLLGEYLAIQPSPEMPNVIAGISGQMAKALLKPELLKHFESSRSKHSVDRREDPLAHMIPFHAQYLDPDQPTVH